MINDHGRVCVGVQVHTHNTQKKSGKQLQSFLILQKGKEKLEEERNYIHLYASKSLPLSNANLFSKDLKANENKQEFKRIKQQQTTKNHSRSKNERQSEDDEHSPFVPYSLDTKANIARVVGKWKKSAQLKSSTTTSITTRM